jgi:hypothetical protein
MAQIIKPPQPTDLSGKRPMIFLAGSIEMGAADNWQEKFEAAFQDENLVILNPRRDEWDASWVHSLDNPQFVEQVEWELNALEQADVIALYFEPATKSPVSLLELGLFARSGKLVVCCPDGFWRKGNVDVVCRKYGVQTVASLVDLIDACHDMVKRKTHLFSG